MRVIRGVAYVCAIGMLLAACGSGGPSRNAAAPSKQASPSTTPSVVSSSTGDNPLASSSPSSVPSETGKPCDAEVDRSPNAGDPGGTYIRAATRPSIRWGPGCEVLSAGDRCEVQWDGAYTVMTGAEAYLSFQAWAKGQKKPFKELTAGPLEPDKSFRKVGFPVTIPSNVADVAFRIVLLDESKTPVAISDAYRYRLNCKPE